jgi:alpha-1,3-fucosyltransferase
MIMHNLLSDKNFFNMTMTYRLDSDVYFGYGSLQELDSGLVASHVEYPVWRKPEPVTGN